MPEVNNGPQSFRDSTHEPLGHQMWMLDRLAKAALSNPTTKSFADGTHEYFNAMGPSLGIDSLASEVSVWVTRLASPPSVEPTHKIARTDVRVIEMTKPELTTGERPNTTITVQCESGSDVRPVTYAANASKTQYVIDSLRKVI